ncbi:CAP domain-containing protein [Sporosarcina sp. G11-34]|uniref:CAP domain-containing protein n=1 Tax=Sporosarcina sp. G11-34 TaxID=2849605 RepID=UPI0022A970A5|nr:CAP-associated domain-containing protein [Sporosarcina sp. G11-34]MCZ2257138.1 hypothetical protein [Sporosarcina sp. G11-34]
MRVLIKVAILLILVLGVFYITGTSVKENRPLESSVKQGTAIPVPENGVGSVVPQTSRPEEGVSTFVGKDKEALIKAKGKPERIEPSGYGYDWWVYLGEFKFMASVTSEGIVNQIYTTDVTLNVTPFEIGQNITDIYRFTIVESEINAEVADSLYTFSLNNEDLQTRPLIVFKGLFVQLYIDQIDGELEAVRFIDPATLVQHQPYEMTYTGDLLVSKPLSSTQQSEVNHTAERQIFEITNTYRARHGMPELQTTYKLNLFAREYSKELALENYIAAESSESEKLSNRLKNAVIEHQKAGENIAFDYVDAIEAVHGWLNSPSHRKVLLDKDFTHIGTGAYGNYYVQDLVKLTKEEIRRN